MQSQFSDILQYPFMFCTICNVHVDGKEHYKSELHGLNARRKIVGYTPFTSEELIGSKDLAKDIKKCAIGNIDPQLRQDQRSIFERLSKGNKCCIFCGADESIDHYKTHQLADDQIYYLLRNQCYVCYEQQLNRYMLSMHVYQGNHRKGFTDGTSLYFGYMVLHPANKRKKPQIFSSSQESSKKTIEYTGDPKHKPFFSKRSQPSGKNAKYFYSFRCY